MNCQNEVQETLRLLAGQDDGDASNAAEFTEWVESASVSVANESGFASVDPAGGVRVLAEWGAPRQLLMEAFAGLAMHRLGYADDHINAKFSSKIYPAQLVKLLDYVTSSRDEEARKQSHRILLKKGYWPAEVLVMLLATYVDSLRRATCKIDSVDASARAFLGHLAMTLFVPLAERLGIWKVRREIKDLAYLCEDEKAYAEDSALRERLLVRAERYAIRVSSLVTDAARRQGMEHFDIRHEIGLTYKIRELRHKHNKSAPGPQDLVNFIPLLPSEEDCRQLVAVLLGIGVSRRSLSDYILRPRENNYQAIHLVLRVLKLGGERARFFIRTEEMQRRADIGILDNWQHGGRLSSEDELIFNQPPDNHIHVFSTDVDERVDLPCNASAVDLAYRIGEFVGDRFHQVHVYGPVGRVGARHALKNGDIVEILQRSTPKPQKWWLNYVKTETASQKIEGYEKRAAEWTKRGSKIVWKGDALDATTAIVSPIETGANRHQFCERCSPYPPDPIVGNRTRKGDITIHLRTCPVVDRAYELIPLKWRDGMIPPVQHRIFAHGWDRKGLLEAVSHEVASRGVNMVEVRASVRTNNTALIAMSINGGSADLIEEIRAAIEDLPHIAKAYTEVTEGTKPGAHQILDHSAIANRYSGNWVNEEGMFFGRANEISSINRILEGVEPNDPIFVTGLARVGKTSLLRKMERLAKGNPFQVYVPVYTDAQSIGSNAQNLVAWFVREVHQVLKRVMPQEVSSTEFQPSSLDLKPEEAFRVYFQEVLSSLAPRYRLALMIDEFQLIEGWPYDRTASLLRCLENLVRENRSVGLVLAGTLVFGRSRTLGDRVRFREWAKIIRLGALSQQAAQHLINIPSFPFVYEEGVVSNILTTTQGYPFLITLLCQNMVDQIVQNQHVSSGPRTQEITMAHYERALSTLLRRDREHVFEHLYDAVEGGREILVEVARLSTKEQEWILLDQLISSIRECHPALYERTHDIVLDLAEVDILDIDASGSGERLRIHIPLFHEWLSRNSLDR